MAEMTSSGGKRATWSGRIRTGLGVLAGAAVLLTGVERAEGQLLEPRFAVAPKLGLAVPAGKFGDYADTGLSANLRVAYELRPGIALTADAGHDRLPGADLLGGHKRAPDLRLTRAVAGVQSRLGDGSTYPLLMRVDVGGGFTAFNSDTFRPTVNHDETKFSKTYPTAAGGFQVEYWMRPGLAVVADSKLYWSFMKKDDTQPLVSIAPVWLEPLGSALTLPFTISLRAGL
jgi:hypothetical protein